MAKPSIYSYVWASDGGAVIATPPDALIQLGYEVGDQPTAEHINSVFNNWTSWGAYLDGYFTATDGRIKADMIYPYTSGTGSGTRIVLSETNGLDIYGATNKDIDLVTAGTGAIGLTSASSADISGTLVTLTGTTDGVAVYSNLYLTDGIGASFLDGIRVRLAGTGSTLPTITRDYSPNGGGWTVHGDNGSGSVTSVGVGILKGSPGAARVDTAFLENQVGGTKSLYAQRSLARTEASSEVVAASGSSSSTEIILELRVVFAATNTEQPTVELIRQTRDGTATEVVLASCTPTAVASRQVVSDSTIATSTALDWKNYKYILRWTATSVSHGAFSRGVEQVLVDTRPSAVNP
jgi:hypothetical protein